MHVSSINGKLVLRVHGSLSHLFLFKCLSSNDPTRVLGHFGDFKAAELDSPRITGRICWLIVGYSIVDLYILRHWFVVSLRLVVSLEEVFRYVGCDRFFAIRGVLVDLNWVE